MIKVADYIVRFIAEQGVRHVFTVAGAGDLHLLDALRRNPDVDYVCNHHEQACTMAMYAYTRATDNFSAGLVTTGPGGTNAITGVCSMWVDSIPGLVLSGQVKVADTIGHTGVRQRGIQEINIIDMVRPVTKYAAMITDPRRVRYELERAVHLARTGRPGPVWLDVPLDVQAAQVDETTLDGFTPEPPDPAQAVRVRNAAERTLDFLAAAERPVLLGGHGIRLAGAAPAFRTLLERLRLPLLLTWNAIDLVESDHSLYVGRPGIYGQRGANFAIQNADCLLSLGSRLSIPQTGYDYPLFARAATKIYVDIDPCELGKFPVPPDLALAADVGDFIQALAAGLERRIAAGTWAPAITADWRARCQRWRDQYPVCPPEWLTDASIGGDPGTGCTDGTTDGTEGVNTFAFMEVLSQALNEGDLILPTGSGSGFTSAHQALRIKRGQRCFTSNGFAEMGFDLPGVIGACIGFGGRPVVTMTGDGGVQMNIQELQTIVHHRLPVKLFIFNNDGYLTIRHTERALFNGALTGTDPATGVSLPDMVKLAEVYGLTTFRIHNRGELCAGIRRALATDGPVLVDVIMDRDQPLVPKTSFRQLPDGRLVSPPLEDLYPFLGRDEFLANMVIPPVEG